MKRINITGKVFNYITVIKYLYTKNTKAYWECKCICNKKIIKSSGDIMYGHVKSCGCKRYKNLGYGISSFNRLYRTYKRNSIKRGHEFNLTKHDLKELTEKNCYYCGDFPKSYIKEKELYGDYIYNGIDRIDNNKGYTLENCVSCCITCNKMKLDMNLDIFLNKIELIYNKHKRLENEEKNSR